MTPSPEPEATPVLTRGLTRTLIRVGAIFCFAAITFLLYAIAPEEVEDSQGVVEASLRPAEPKPLKGVPPFKDVLNPDASLFAYRQAFRAPGTRAFQVFKEPVAVAEPAVPVSPPPPPPDPPPDVSGLQLVAVQFMENNAGLALVKDGENTQTVVVGDTLRNARVERVEAGAVVLKKGDQEARLESSPLNSRLVMRPFKTVTLPVGKKPAVVKSVPGPDGAAPPAAPAMDPQAMRKTLGISIKEVSLFDVNKLKRNIRSRVQVRSLSMPRSDIKTGDMILSINGKNVITAKDALTILDESKTEPEVRMRLWRDGGEFDVRLKWKEPEKE